MSNAPAVGASVSAANPLFRMLETCREVLGECTWGTWGGIIDRDFGVHLNTEYLSDQEGEYVVIGFVLPDGFYAEVNDDTYGLLCGFRIYREDVGAR